MFRMWCRQLLGMAIAAVWSAGGGMAMGVALQTETQAPVPVGTRVQFTVDVSDAAGSNQWYRFGVTRQGGNYQVVRDYSPVNTFEWTESQHEGTFEIEVSVRDLDTGEMVTDSKLVQFRPIATGRTAVVTPTDHPLVFLYSAPACGGDGRMRVMFTGPGGVAQSTPYMDCNGLTMNFYLAGMLAESTYTAHHVLDTGTAFRTSADVSFTTGAAPGAGLATESVLVAAKGTSTDPILLGSPLSSPPVAHDLAGNLLWWGPADLSLLTRTEAGGYMWGLVEAYNEPPSRQLLRKFDLAGMTVLETNAARVNEQLQAMGRRTITAFHHEARPLPGGRIVTLGLVEQILTDVQGPGPVDVVGDMVIVLDRDLNVIWAWDTFDHLDPQRKAVMGETCPQTCPPPSLAETAMDWTHGNAVQQTPDGNLLYSSRHQDWLVKIAYDYGGGDGHVIWRMGAGGDFAMQSTDAYPWFSHQHDGNFLASDPTQLLVFDDGNTRIGQMGSGNSRGQVLRVDEDNRTATPVLNADLGVYSQAVGSAQRLRNGDYHFDAGFVVEDGTTDAYSIEVAPSGNIVYNAKGNVILYRTFRLADLYSTN